MSRRLRENSLSIVLFGLFAVFLLGQSLTGWRAYDAEQREHHEPDGGTSAYLTTGHFVEATFENWESEFLQMAAYVLLTIWLVQKGSSESKPLGGDPEKDADPEQGRSGSERPGLSERVAGGSCSTRTPWGSRSRSSSCCRSSCTPSGVPGIQRRAGRSRSGPVSTVGFVTTSTFWFQSFQNWQSEFVAVGSIVVLTIFLRQRGSPESKPVAAAHRETPR